MIVMWALILLASIELLASYWPGLQQPLLIDSMLSRWRLLWEWPLRINTGTPSESTDYSRTGVDWPSGNVRTISHERLTAASMMWLVDWYHSAWWRLIMSGWGPRLLLPQRPAANSRRQDRHPRRSSLEPVGHPDTSRHHCSPDACST